MTLYEALNQRLAFYRQVALFGLQKNDSKVVALCVRVMNETLPKEFRAKLTEQPSKDHKMADAYSMELLEWSFGCLPLVEEKYTEYMNTIAMQLRH